MLVEDQDARVELLTMIDDGADAMRNLALIANQITSPPPSLRMKFTASGVTASAAPATVGIEWIFRHRMRMRFVRLWI